MNLVLALVWLLMGVGCFLVSWQHPEAQLGFFEVKLSTVGLFAVLMCCYNLARWWSLRAFYRWRQPPPPPVRAPSTLPREPDPNFDFSEHTPRRPPETPPSS